ncbi:DNA-binding response regulator [Blastococcus sp. TF02-09]|uniref:response regulator n=1 Tax=Blastococcus sp. TF02-09 TaxID=2250576 RepID=UPI000DE86059|nr:response regulator transcription factor [Blastococcus sp. TF02-9]RBY75655.1 DNA-binding response regulator [Blastococcus sp. TF02-9]
MIRVLVVDDHRVVLAGLARVIDAAEDMQVVGLAPDGDVAVDLAARTLPDVVLMDLSMPRVDGVTATRRVLALSPASYVLVLTSFSDRERIVDAFQAGAVGYMLKDSEPDDLLKALRAAARGESPLDPRVAREVLRSGPVLAARPELTDRERAVLRLVSQGLANKQIATRLGIREGTVKAHLSHVFQRIGVSDRTSAALWARAHLGSEAT